MAEYSSTSSAYDRGVGIEQVIDWYRLNQRSLPWREPGVGPWAILVSEVMLQQTPVSRVEPVWREWMARWPEPADLASATLAEVLRYWGRLGYPRRAQNLHRAAQIIHSEHNGVVPEELDSLLALPGVGAYTARAVLCFSRGDRHPVVDTNVSRVIARWQHGLAAGASWSHKRSLQLADEALSTVSDEVFPEASVAVMELGALVCTAKNPACDRCPLLHECQWRAAGYPVDPRSLPRGQARYEGSDRQARGVILRALRDSPGGLDEHAVLSLWPHPTQLRRALASLVKEGLVSEHASDSGHWLQLPGD